MKKQTILNYILATFIVVLLFYIRTSADYPEKQPMSDPILLGGTCNYSNVGGFAAAKAVERATARTQATAFQEFAAGRGMTILGGVISKAALDSLFCGGVYNGLAYQLAMDPSGKHGPANSIFVIVGGVKAEDVNGTMTIKSQSSNFYTNNLWCPPSCMSFQ